MELFRTTEHLGLKTALPQPPGNSAKALSNFVRHPHNGWLEQADGYGPKFTLPVSDTYTTLISIQDIHNFYVKEHGGQQITVCVGTYKKRYRHSATLTPTKVGIWVSHTWNGAAWVFGWVELTEVEYFALDEVKLIGGQPYVELQADYGFADNYFTNWIITFADYSQAEDHDNYLLCQGNIIDVGDSEHTSLKFFGSVSDLVARSAGALVIVSRNFFGADTPASLSSHIFSLYNEIRVTTGNTSSDMNFMVGYRDKDFGWATTDAATDKLIAEPGCLDIWRFAFGASQLSAVASSKPLPVNNYLLKYSLKLDDGNETEIRGASTAVTAESDVVPDLSVSSNYNITPGYDGASCTDGTYVYIATIDAALGAPYLVKIDPRINSEVGRVALLLSGVSGAGKIGGVTYGSGCVYVSCNNSSVCIAKVDAELMTQIGDALVIASDAKTAGKITLLGGFLYCVSGDSITFATIHKVNPSSSPSMGIIGSIELHPGGGAVIDITAIEPFGSNLMVGFDIQTSPTISRLKEINTATFLVVKTLDLITSGVGKIGAIYCPDSSTVVVGTNKATAKIIKINWLTDVETAGTFTGDYITGFVFSESYLYVLFGGVSPQVSNRFSLTEMASNGDTLSTGLTTSNTRQVVAIDGYLYALSFLQSTPVGYLTRINLDSFQNIFSDGSVEIQFNPLISPSTTPKRSKKLKVYISNDNGVFYYLIKEINLLATAGDISGIAWDSAAYYDPIMKHFYHKGEPISINLDDWNAIGALSSVVLGRDSADSGSIKYKNSTIVGNSTYASNVLIGTPAVNEVNKVVACAVGEGIPMVDVFPNDVANVIDVEYSDGDQIVGSLPLADRLFVMKKRSLVLVTNTGSEFERDQVAQGIGCCSIRTARSFEDINYFCDYNGIYSYSTGSLRLLNGEWLLDWKAYTVAQKEAAFAVIDTINRKYIVSINGVQYAYDIDSERNDAPGEWMSYSWANAPLQFAVNAPDSTNPGSIDFLTSAKIENLSKATFQDSQDFTMTWESNEINALIGKEGYAFDVLMQHIVFEYQSALPITATVYLDGSAKALSTITLEASYTKKTVLLPLSAKCKTYRVKYSATTTGSAQSPTPYAVAQAVKIKSRIDYFATIPAGGDILSI